MSRARTGEGGEAPCTVSSVASAVVPAAAGSVDRTSGNTIVNRKWVTAESIAIATGIGYAMAFLYQAGRAAYYGVPLETIRVSPEWVIFIGVALVPSVFLLLSHSTISTVVGHSRHRRSLRWVLAILGLVVGGGATLVGSHALSSLAGLVSVLLLSASLSDWLSGGIEAFERRGKRPNAYVAALVLIGSLLFVMSWITWMGISSASSQDAYLVDAARRRVLVYSTDSLYVFADYDAATSSLRPRLTYVAASSLGTIQLDYVKTGRLKSAIPLR